MPTWIASGPGNDWQIAMASRICSLLSHFRSETSSRSICPTRATGPPNPSKPRRRKYITSSPKRRPSCAVALVMDGSYWVVPEHAREYEDSKDSCFLEQADERHDHWRRNVKIGNR